MARILIVDDEASLRTVLSRALRKEGYEVVTAETGERALEILDASVQAETREPFQLVISDVRMPGMNGMQVLEEIKRRYDDLPVVLLTAHGTVDMAVQALKQGAFDFVTKPYERDEFLSVINKALQQQEAETKESHGRGLIGKSEAIREVMAVIDRVADSPSTVLITGESGTGKELVATALHEKSSRKDAPFIRINCAAIPPTLIEAELFGHEKGAFTGAISQKPGRFELAHQGTLFLDEVGELPVEMQVKLLRALQEGTFERVGGVQTLEVDVRLIAATNLDLEEALKEGTFREDLYYRLNVVPVALPPLRERKEDIPELVEHFVAKFNERLERQVKGLCAPALALLAEHSWPGNIRELENIIERTVLFTDADEIDVDDLPPDLVNQVQPSRVPDLAADAQKEMATGESSMKDIVKQATAEIEKTLIQDALSETNGNVTHAAKRLKISRKSLQIKMRDFGLRDDDRPPEESPADA